MILKTTTNELYHHVLDKYGWAWRDPKYKVRNRIMRDAKVGKRKRT